MFYKNFKIVLIIVGIILILLTSLCIYHFCSNKNDKKNISNVPVFSIDKIILYSSASATNNETTYQKAYWDLNIYQYTDIAIYINNKNASSELSPENTIKTLYIDNINYTKMPQIGTPSLYYKKYSDFGLDKISANNINNDLEFTVYSSNETNYDIPAFYADCSTPITLGFVNNDIVTNHILLHSGQPITYDGSILQNANIPLTTISTSISFNINIVNNLNESFTCNVIIPINLKTETESIYSGNITETQNTNFKFEKI